MPDRNDAAFELILTRAAASLAYPATPQFTSRVLSAIAAERAEADGRSSEARDRSRPRLRVRAGHPPRPAFALATIAAAIAAFAAVLALALPGSRSAIADFFGIEGSTIERLPTPPPGTTATPFPPAADLPQGARQIAINDLASALGFAPALPDGAGDPRSAYIVAYAGRPIAILRYDGFDLWQTKLKGEAFVKGVQSGARVEEFELRPGVPARWLTGGMHTVGVTRADGSFIEESLRTVDANTLIFATDAAFYRIETDLDREDAVRIAKSLP